MPIPTPPLFMNLPPPPLPPTPAPIHGPPWCPTHPTKPQGTPRHRVEVPIPLWARASLLTAPLSPSTCRWMYPPPSVGPIPPGPPQMGQRGGCGWLGGLLDIYARWGAGAPPSGAPRACMPPLHCWCKKTPKTALQNPTPFTPKTTHQLIPGRPGRQQMCWGWGWKGVVGSGLVSGPRGAVVESFK